MSSNHSQIPVFNSTAMKWCWAGVGGLLLLGCGAFVVDLPISQWLHTHQKWKVLHQPLQVVEAYGDGAGVALLLVTLWIVAPARRRELFRCCFAVISAGLAANLVKLAIARIRPQSFPDLTNINTITDTFAGWGSLLWSKADLATEAVVPLKSLSQIQSFPSGHTATGVALAVALTRLFPRGGWWFAILAAAIALQRVETGAHYVSDTCFGAAVGLLVALSWQSGTPWAQWADRWETATDDPQLVPVPEELTTISPQAV